MTTALTPLKKSITVPWPLEAAFQRFTVRIADWWPMRSHSVGGERTQKVVFEGREGGRIYEIERDGEQHDWGRITVWDPPGRVAFTWHPGRTPDTAQEVEVRFTATREGTRVDLIHTGWERLGDLARRARRGYPIGWAYVLRLYAGRTRSPLIYTMDALTWAIGAAQRLRGRQSS